MNKDKNAYLFEMIEIEFSMKDNIHKPNLCW